MGGKCRAILVLYKAKTAKNCCFGPFVPYKVALDAVLNGVVGAGRLPLKN
jgi:hypothetical protein